MATQIAIFTASGYVCPGWPTLRGESGTAHELLVILLPHAHGDRAPAPALAPRS